MKHKKTKNTERGIINPNGIIIEGDIALSTKYETGKDRMILLKTLLCILAATFTMMILGAFIGVKTVTIFPVALTAFSFTAISTKNIMLRIYGIGYLLLQISYFVILFNEIITGIKIALVRYQNKADISVFDFIENDLSKLHLNQENIDYYLFHAMMFIAALVTVFTAISCILRTDFPVFFIATFPFLEIGLFFGWNPPAVAAVGLVVCWITMLSFSMLNHSTNKAGMNNTFAVHRRKEAFFFTSRKYKNRFFTYYLSGVALVCAVIFAASVLTSAITGFVRPKSFQTLRSRITQFAYDIPEMIDDLIDRMFNKPKEVGVTNGGKLGTKDEISFTDSVALDIQISRQLNRTLYLKGYVAGDYDKNEWTPIDPDKSDEAKLNNAFEKYADGVPIQNFNHTAVKTHGIPAASTTISLYNANADKRFVYAPYMSDYLSQNMTDRANAEGDGGVAQLDSSYMIDFDDLSDLSNSWDLPGGIIDQLSSYKMYVDSLDSLNKTYYQFIDKYYTKVTDSPGLEQVYNDISDNLAQYPYDVMNSYQSERLVASAISNYLNANYRYTLKPKALPADGEDFIDFFLSKNKEGYCTYFATAGTMLMRKFGFPARYVEGFIVTPKDYFVDNNGHIHAQATDRAAHAWCEVFISNVGWVPLEFTPGYNSGNNPNDPDKQMTTTTTTTTTPTTTTTSQVTTIATTTASGSASSNSSQASSVSSSAASVTNDTKGGGTGKAGTEEPSKFIAFLKASAIYILLLAAMMLIFVLNRSIKLKKQQNQIAQEDKAKAFLWIYVYYLRYLELINISDDSNISDEAQALKLIAKCLKKDIEKIIPDITYLSSVSIEIHLSRNRQISEEEHEKALSALKLLKNEIVPERLSFIGRIAAKWIYGLY